MQAVIAVGVGFRSGCDAASLVRLIRAALAGRTADVLGAPGFKAGAPALAAAETLGLLLSLLDDAALRAVAGSCPTRSSAALRATGHASVAEACALAAAGPGARLIVARMASGQATCAVATT